MRFCSLGSGSAGNATLIEASQGITRTTLLVDCGFSQRELALRLQRAGSDIGQISAIFITHEHGDHVGCALSLAQRHRLPLWMSRGSWRAVQHQPAAAALDRSLLHFAADGETLDLGDMRIHPFAVPHDAAEPLQLCCEDGRHRLGLLTDLGSSSPGVLAQLRGCDALLLEFNHDETLLREGPYPPSLKRRILGSHGHLSNAAAAELLLQCLHPGLQHVVAAHLSERNNRTELVAQLLEQSLPAPREQGRIADQAQGTDWLSLHGR